MEVPVQTKELIVESWLERILRTYPCQATGFLKNEKDPFRNPVGHAFKEALPILLDEILLGMDKEKILPALDAIVRVRAVQAFTASQAVGFVFELKEVLRQACPQANLDLLYPRIDEIAMMAFDIFEECREKLHQSRVNETRRRVFVLERAMSARGTWKERAT
jgi:RsbRD-like negative regulator of sigma factor